MYDRLKISQHKHSGRLRPHEHTSYVPLIFLVLVVGVMLTGFTMSVLAASPGPEAGSVGLTGTVPSPPPKVAATITTPHSQQRFGTSPIKVAGTCPAKTLVEIYKNDIFAGSTDCDDKGNFSLEVDLLIGPNTLIARVYDDLNQAGPDSNAVPVFYDALPPQSSPTSFLSFGGPQLLLNTDAVYRGIFPDQLFNIPINIIGGVPPYAVDVQWGDSTHKIIPRGDNLAFNASHSYHKPGIYNITIQATDSQGRVAFLSVAAIVNGQPSPVAAANGGGTTPKTPKLLVLWPAFAIVATMVISFWLGERREKHILLPHGA